VLQWARDHDCLWNERTREWAVQNRDTEMLRWLDEHGAPCSL